VIIDVEILKRKIGEACCGVIQGADQTWGGVKLNEMRGSKLQREGSILKILCNLF
jgi:hypothetical protein